MRDIKRLKGTKVAVSSTAEALRIVRIHHPMATMEGSVGSYSFAVGDELVGEAWLQRRDRGWWLRVKR